MKNVITIDQFAAIDLRVATVLEAKDHPKADKLMILKVSLGDEERQIVAGIRPHCVSDKMVGKQIIVVANLEPRALRGEMSHGMLLAIKDEDTLSLVSSDKVVKSGLQVG
jgi:methionyl-tRNA synthetase